MSNRPRQKAGGLKKTLPVSGPKPTQGAVNPDQPKKPASLKKTLYLVFAVVSLLIGLHRVYLDSATESISTAIGYNYWIFMITIAFLILLRYERKKPQA